MVRIGVIGCGKIAQTRHLPEYAGNKDCKIIGVYDLNFERASEIASQYDATAYSSVEELLADQQIDAVSICSYDWSESETCKGTCEGKTINCRWCNWDSQNI